MSENQELLEARAHAVYQAENVRYLNARIEEARANPQAFMVNSARPPFSDEAPPFDTAESLAVIGRVHSTLPRLVMKNQASRPGGAPPSPPVSPPPAAHYPPPVSFTPPAPPPPAASSSLAARDYATLSSAERQRLAGEDPDAFARNRADWERRGCPLPRTEAAPKDAPYENWSNAERLYVAQHDPARFESARNDWVARGEPVEDDVA